MPGTPAPATDPRRLSDIAYGFMASKALFAALELNLFTELAPQRWLVHGAPEDVGDYFRVQVAGQIYPALLHLDAGIAGTGAAFDTLRGLLSDPREAHTFIAAQHVGSLGAARALARRLPIRGARRMLDVGG